MKTFSLLAAASCLALALPLVAAPASAQGFRDHGRFCHIERTVKFTPFGKRVIVRRVCR